MSNHVILALGLAVLFFQCCFWAIRIRDFLRSLQGVPTVIPVKEGVASTNLPLISVIVPAHNEEAGIRACLESVLIQDYPRFELILVDDRSTDGTAAVAESLVPLHDHFRIVSVRDLPPGWTGKCHALYRAVRRARGEWLAFLDADCRLSQPAALRMCYRLAQATGVNMVTLSPKFVVRTFWEKALQPVFAGMSCILFPPDRINDPSSPIASANGMFFLISRRAYDRIGGHRDVRDLAVEDIGIGKRVKAAGLGLLFANGKAILNTRMYTNLSEILAGWTRILSASMNYEVTTVLRFLVVQLLISFPMFLLALCAYVPLSRELWPSAWVALPLLCMIEMGIVLPLFCCQLGVPKKYCVLLALGNLLLIWVFLVIVRKIQRKDALQWRGTTYESNRYQPTRLDPISSGV